MKEWRKSRERNWLIANCLNNILCKYWASAKVSSIFKLKGSSLNDLASPQCKVEIHVFLWVYQVKFKVQCVIWNHVTQVNISAILALYEEIWSLILRSWYLDEQSLHAGPDVGLSEERTGSLQPEHALQHPQPLLQQVGGVRLQVVHTLTCHHLQDTGQTPMEGGGRGRESVWIGLGFGVDFP